MWHEQAIIKWSHWVISIVACCHYVKFCACAARAFQSQQGYHPCHLINSTNRVHLMANNSSNAFASDCKINIAMLNFGNAKKLCLFCLKRQNNIHGFTWADQDWIGPMIFKNFPDQDWIGLNFCGSGLDSD